MKKPEKKFVCSKKYCLSNQGYNQCWDDREKWLPSEEELEDYITKKSIRFNAKVDILGIGIVKDKHKVYFKFLAKAIHRRLGGKQ